MKLITNSYVGLVDGFLFQAPHQGVQHFKFTNKGRVVDQMNLPEGQFETMKTKIFTDESLDLTEIQSTFLAPDDATAYQLISPLQTEAKRLAAEAAAATTGEGGGAAAVGGGE